MRLAVALSVTIQGIATLVAPNSPTLSSWTIGVVAILVGAALLIGFLTPIAGASAAIGNSVMGLSLLGGSGASAYDKAFIAIDLVVLSIALVLLGPGAFSVDARLFGRREIIIPKGRRPPLL
jgi:uncharacterized membrane protein YphA (DoxX/SURF4 family)